MQNRAKHCALLEPDSCYYRFQENNFWSFECALFVLLHNGTGKGGSHIHSIHLCKHVSMISAVLAAALIAVPMVFPGSAFAAEDPVGYAETRYSGADDPGSTCTETEIGNAVADAVRQETGAEVAVIPGGIIVNDLGAGAVTASKLRSLFAEEEQIAVSVFTPAELYQYMELAISCVTVDDAQKIDYEASSFIGYPQISGFSMKFDVSAPIGQRILSLSTNDSEVEYSPEDTSSVLLVASTEGMFSGAYGLPVRTYKLFDETITDALIHFTAAGGLSGAETGRVEIIGVSDRFILNGFPLQAAAWVLLLLITAARLFYHAKPSFANGFLPQKQNLQPRQTQDDSFPKGDRWND